ncbi:MAG TPA: hypothetical protein VFL98_03395 [Candidatus Paceibacterota bacterium]|nr:hypothetical protein [Candidatus Paceibacterota bacterium]
MEFSTSTSVAIQDGILTVLIFISNLVFKWVPAAMNVLLAQLTGTAVPAAVTSGTGTQVGLEASSYAPSGIETGTTALGSAATTAPATPAAETISFGSQTLHTAWSIFAPLSIFISLLIATWVVYALIRLSQVKRAEKQALAAVRERPTPHIAAQPVEAGPSDAQKRWARIETQIASDNENEWRLAILEADIMLDEALERAGYTGDTIGDKLKSAQRGDFKTLDLAWDAHKVRNHIAHRGTAHDLNQREAKRVIGEYEQVFHEFNFI